MVPGQRVCVHHIFHGIRSQIYLWKNFFQSISQVVDEMFEKIICPGKCQISNSDTVPCDGQAGLDVTWGSKYLGDQGYSAIIPAQLLRK